MDTSNQLKSVAQTDREFLEACYQSGWRYSDRANGHFPSVHGTHEWQQAMTEAKAWCNSKAQITEWSAPPNT